MSGFIEITAPAKKLYWASQFEDEYKYVDRSKNKAVLKDGSKFFGVTKKLLIIGFLRIATIPISMSDFESAASFKKIIENSSIL